MKNRGGKSCISKGEGGEVRNEKEEDGGKEKAKTSVCRESVCQVSCTVSHLVHAALFGTGQEKGSIIPTLCHLLYYSLSSLFIIGHPLRTQVLNEIKTGKHSHLHGPARAAWRKKEAHYLLWCGLLR